jgi:L-lactate permease
MFALLQKAAASRTGLSLLWLAAAQNGAGQLARMLSPACLLLAATSAGLKGQEGLLLRTCGPLVLWTIALHMLLLAGILTPSPLVIGGGSSCCCCPVCRDCARSFWRCLRGKVGTSAGPSPEKPSFEVEGEQRKWGERKGRLLRGDGQGACCANSSAHRAGGACVACVRLWVKPFPACTGCASCETPAGRDDATRGNVASVHMLLCSCKP